VATCEAFTPDIMDAIVTYIRSGGAERRDNIKVWLKELETKSKE
jgi:hypothetical protein